MRAAHTPGPWKWDGNPCAYNKEQEAPWIVAGLRDELQVLSGEIVCHNEFDMRLIAAAPDLLEALNFLVGCSAPMTGQQEQCWISIRAAIAKATVGNQS